MRFQRLPVVVGDRAQQSDPIAVTDTLNAAIDAFNEMGHGSPTCEAAREQMIDEADRTVR